MRFHKNYLNERLWLGLYHAKHSYGFELALCRMPITLEVQFWNLRAYVCWDSEKR